MISIWESLRSYFPLLPSLTRVSPVYLPWDVQETLITRGKQVISKMHLHASQLMELYGEQYVFVETDHEHGISIRFRTLPKQPCDGGNTDCRYYEMGLEVRWASGMDWDVWGWWGGRGVEC